MITGILGFMMFGCFFPLPGVLAFVLGLIALSQIKKSPEKYGGKPYATAGVIMGGISVLFFVAMIIWLILSAALS